MAKTSAFDQHALAYDAWFTDNQAYFKAELEAIRCLFPGPGKGIEIGVGTGRFAQALDIHWGIEPSKDMYTIARDRGITIINGVAEALPIKAESFDHVLLVTTICFLDSLTQSLEEVFRILKQKGLVLIGFIEKESELGRKYQSRKKKSRYYKDATFHSVDEVLHTLRIAGFTDFKFTQTLFAEDGETAMVPKVKAGHDKGAFIVVRAQKK